MMGIILRDKYFLPPKSITVDTEYVFFQHRKLILGVRSLKTSRSIIEIFELWLPGGKVCNSCPLSRQQGTEKLPFIFVEIWFVNE